MNHIKSSLKPLVEGTLAAILLITISFSWLSAQDTESAPPDTTAPADTSAPTFEVPLPIGLENGYKGYAWGSDMGAVPQLEYMDSASIGSDSLSITMTGSLGPDRVNMEYHYSDGGFWKVEIDYELNPDDVDEQIKLFNRVEKNVTEVYGPPKGTSQLLSGPSSTYADAMNIKYARAFYRSTWNVTPVKVELILSGLVQTPTAEFQIFDRNPSVMKLVYYNPDFMISEQEETETEELPSIFDIY